MTHLPKELRNIIGNYLQWDKLNEVYKILNCDLRECPEFELIELYFNREMKLNNTSVKSTIKVKKKIKELKDKYPNTNYIKIVNNIHKFYKGGYNRDYNFWGDLPCYLDVLNKDFYIKHIAIEYDISEYIPCRLINQTECKNRKNRKIKISMKQKPI